MTKCNMISTLEINMNKNGEGRIREGLEVEDGHH
jgi:hypothetical protein